MLCHWVRLYVVVDVADFANPRRGSVWSQAKGHMYGSHNLGNGKEEIYGAIAICDAIEKQLGIKVNREPKENWAWTAKAEKW